ncbi:MAG: hypothetical protein JHC95_00920 [Solirubrobacteraceae bacterium]|nr:hypothetical protein [Solirubrobacteraceae bacterium]
MRFAEFLKATVLLCAGSATALALVAALAGGEQQLGSRFATFLAAWWVVATLIGSWLGRRAETTPPIARLLGTARSANSLPEMHPGRMLLNRLWPLVATTILGIGLAFLAPQIPGIAAGFAIIWALAWRRQHSAVSAIEHRDGVEFYLERTPPGKSMQLVRVPGLKRDLSSISRTGASV